MSTIEAIEFYWRPGCGFCMALERNLERAGIPMNRHNIWESPDDAAIVRSIAGGNETVPTVVVGEIGMVNPRLAQVVEALEVEAPHLVPDKLPEGPLGRIASRLFGRDED